MDIMFYRVTDDKRKLTKTLGNVITLSGHVVDDVSLVNPEIVVGFNSNLSVCNYCYIPAFARYYYITNIQVSNKTMIISMHCDVLMSFRNDILTSTAKITRSNIGNKYIPDNMVKQTSKINRQVKKIGSGFTPVERYIIQIGG